MDPAGNPPLSTTTSSSVRAPPQNNCEINSVSFNQDYSCIAVGLKTGFNVYNTCPFGKCYSNGLGGVSIVQMLYCSSLVALVGNGEKPGLSPQKLHMYNTKNNSPICELNFVTPILGVRLNRKRVIVVRNNKIHIHDINNMKILETLDTVANPHGLCALSPDDNSYIAYPGKGTGEVCLYDALSLCHVTTLSAHKANLSCVSFNRLGSLLATASEKGTIIRVFQIPEAKKSYSFRRGAHQADVGCLSFSLDSKLLCVSSDTGTVHVFRIDETTSTEGTVGRRGIMGPFIPDLVSDMMEPVRSFAHIKLPFPGPVSLCAFSEGNDYLIAVSNGNVYHYVLDGTLEYKLSYKKYLLEDSKESTA